MSSTVHLHTDPDGNPADDVGKVDIVIDKLLTNVVFDLLDIIPNPSTIEQSHTAVFPDPPKIDVWSPIVVF